VAWLAPTPLDGAIVSDPEPVRMIEAVRGHFSSGGKAMRASAHSSVTGWFARGGLKKHWSHNDASTYLKTTPFPFFCTPPQESPT